MIGAVRIEELAAKMRAQADELFGEDSALGPVLIVAEVLKPGEDEDDPPKSEVISICSDGRIVKMGLLVEAFANQY